MACVAEKISMCSSPLTMTVTCATWNLIDRRCVRDAERDSPKKFFDFS